MVHWMGAFSRGIFSPWQCSSVAEAVVGFRYRRRAGSGGSFKGGGRRSSVNGGDIGSKERVRYSSREIAGAVKLERERAAVRSIAKDAVKLDLNPNFRPDEDGWFADADSTSLGGASGSRTSPSENDKSGWLSGQGSVFMQEGSFGVLSV